MRMRIAAWLCVGMIMSFTASAHHGFGNFAMNEDIELTGVVTRLDMVNPHSWLHFDVTGEDGETVGYRCELRSATTLRRSGWGPEMFPPGMRITIQGSPDRGDPLLHFAVRPVRACLQDRALGEIRPARPEGSVRITV